MAKKKNKGIALYKEFITQLVTLSTSAFGLAAALAWNEAVKSLINEILPKGQGVLPLFIYAVIVTVLAVIVMSRLMTIKEKFENEETEKK